MCVCVCVCVRARVCMCVCRIVWFENGREIQVFWPYLHVKKCICGGAWVAQSVEHPILGFSSGQVPILQTSNVKLRKLQELTEGHCCGDGNLVFGLKMYGCGSPENMLAKI